MARSPDAKAVSKATRPAPPSPGTEVAALTADEVCKRDGERLVRLRNSSSSDEAGRFAKELGCEKLRPQLLGSDGELGPRGSRAGRGGGLERRVPGRESCGARQPATVLAFSRDESRGAHHRGRGLQTRRGAPRAAAQQPLAATRLGASRRSWAARSCDRRLLGLMESLGHAVPAPAAAEVSNGGSPDAKAVGEATRPAPLSLQGRKSPTPLRSSPQMPLPRPWRRRAPRIMPFTA